MLIHVNIHIHSLCLASLVNFLLIQAEGKCATDLGRKCVSIWKLENKKSFNFMQDTQRKGVSQKRSNHIPEKPRRDLYFKYLWTQGGAFGSWAGEKLHDSRIIGPRQIWHKEIVSKIFSVVFVKHPPSHKQCSRALYMRDYPLISIIGTLMATPTQTLLSDWFIGNSRRKLFFSEEALSHSDAVRQRGIHWQWSQRFHLQIMTVNIFLHF